MKKLSLLPHVEAAILQQLPKVFPQLADISLIKPTAFPAAEFQRLTVSNIETK